MGTCTACTEAERAPRRDEFAAACDSCTARAFAAIGGHLESQEAGRMTAHYRESLQALFGEGWKRGAELTKQWAEKIARADKSTKGHA